MKHLNKLSPRGLILMDASGALVSTIFSGWALPLFSYRLGIEPSLLRSLAILAFLFMVYDLIIYFSFKVIRPWMIKTIMSLNLSYCVLSTLLMIFLPEISHEGIAVLAVEIVVVLSVVGFEYLILREMIKSQYPN